MRSALSCCNNQVIMTRVARNSHCTDQSLLKHLPIEIMPQSMQGTQLCCPPAHDRTDFQPLENVKTYIFNVQAQLHPPVFKVQREFLSNGTDTSLNYWLWRHLPDKSQQSVQLRQRTDHSMWSSAEELLLTRSRSASIMVSAVSGWERYSYSGMGARYWVK